VCGLSGLWIFNVETGVPQVLTERVPGFKYPVAISRDGKRLAYSSCTFGKPDEDPFHLMDLR